MSSAVETSLIIQPCRQSLRILDHARSPRMATGTE
jgi:hypothetical protein